MHGDPDRYAKQNRVRQRYAVLGAPGCQEETCKENDPAENGEYRNYRRSPATDAGRRLKEVHNQRTRVQDGHERGVYSTSEAAKRIAAIEGEIATPHELLGRDDGPIVISQEQWQRSWTYSPLGATSRARIAVGCSPHTVCASHYARPAGVTRPRSRASRSG